MNNNKLQEREITGPLKILSYSRTRGVKTLFHKRKILIPNETNKTLL